MRWNVVVEDKEVEFGEEVGQGGWRRRRERDGGRADREDRSRREGGRESVRERERLDEAK